MTPLKDLRRKYKCKFSKEKLEDIRHQQIYKNVLCQHKVLKMQQRNTLYCTEPSLDEYIPEADDKCTPH